MDGINEKSFIPTSILLLLTLKGFANNDLIIYQRKNKIVPNTSTKYSSSERECLMQFPSYILN